MKHGCRPGGLIKKTGDEENRNGKRKGTFTAEIQRRQSGRQNKKMSTTDGHG